MSTKLTYNKSYVGPRALFDPFYIPDRLIGLKKQEKDIESLIKDAFDDHYPLTLSLYGTKGIGKTTLARKVIASLSDSKHKKVDSFYMYYVNCEEKESDQILFSIINDISQTLGYELELDSILKATLGNQLNLLTNLISKSLNTQNLLIFLDSVEYTPPQLINKVADICSTQCCHLITSFNVLKSSPYLSEFNRPDFQFQLSTYSPSNLEKISKDRCDAAFSHPIEETMIRYLTDLITHFGYSVPESCVHVLRELFPLIEKNSLLNPGEIQDACRYQFKGYSIDELSIAEFISETDMVDRLALDEISSFFHSQTRFYITHPELNTMYKIACENIEDVYNQGNFERFLSGMKRVGLMQSSNFDPKTVQKAKLSRAPKSQAEKYYFLTISPQMLSEILDVAFGLVSFD